MFVLCWRPTPGPLRRRGRSRRCWSSEKSELQYETLMNNRADFSASNNNQKLQIASPSPRQAQCKLRLRETLMVTALSPRHNRLTRLILFNAEDSERTMRVKYSFIRSFQFSNPANPDSDSPPLKTPATKAYTPVYFAKPLISSPPALSSKPFHKSQNFYFIK